MKLFEVEKSRMESRTFHAALLKPKALSHQDIDALSTRLESLTMDYEILYKSKEESILRARLEAIETRHGLMSLESDLTLRAESLGEWITSMIQKVLDAIVKFFDWIFGSGKEEEKIDDAVEKAGETIKKAEEVSKKPAKSKDGGTAKVGDAPVTVAPLKSHFKLAGQAPSGVAHQTRVLASSLSAVKTLISLLSKVTEDSSSEPVVEMIKALGLAKGTPPDRPEAEIISSFQTDAYRFTVIGLSKSKNGYQFTKTVLKENDDDESVPETFTLDEFSLKILPALIQLGKRYAETLAESEKAFKKNENEYRAALKNAKNEDLKPVVFKARLSLTLMEAVKSYSWVPNVIKAVTKEMDKGIGTLIGDPRVKTIEI